MMEMTKSLSQKTKKHIYVISATSVLCFLMIWQFFWSDNSSLRFNPYLFWPLMAAASLIAVASRKVKISLYSKMIIFSLVWCSVSSLFSPSWISGIAFLLEILLYFIAVKLFTNKGIEFTKIAYGFCIAHMFLLLLQVFAPFVFYFFVGLISGSSKVALLKENAGNGIFYGFTGQTSTIAFYLVFGLIISLYNFAKGKKLNYFFLLFGILFEISLLLTNRRGGTLISLAVIAFFVFLDKRKLSLKISLAIVIALVLMAIGLDRIPGFKGIVEKFQITSERNNSLSGRTQFWDYCIETFKAKPIFGSGFYSFSQNTQFEVETAHNSYLQKMAEIGIVGTMVFFVPHIYTLFISFRMFFSNKENSNEKKYMLLMILLQLSFLLFAIFEGVFETPILFVFIFLIEYAVVDKYKAFKKKGFLYENSCVNCR